MSPTAAVVRFMSRDDLSAVATRSAQLGYPCALDEAASRWTAITAAESSRTGLFVAEVNAVVMGWLHVVRVFRLDSDGYAGLLSLVVDAAHRRRGIGRLLVQQACEWTRAAGFARLRLRSGLHRGDAHAFYAALGFDIARPGHTFQKRV